MRDARRLRRGDALQYGWPPDEVEGGDMQVDGGFQVLEFLGKAQRQPGKPPHERSDRQVASQSVLFNNQKNQ